MNKILLSLMLACAAIVPVQAQEAAEQALRGVLGVGFTYGGDKLAAGTQANNDLRAGKGLLFVAGADYRVNPHFSLQGTVGYHIDAVNSYYGGTATFKRIPVEMLAYFQPNERFRIGGGLRYASSARFDEGAGEHFDSKVGAVVEGEFFVTKSIGLKLRAVSEKFTSSQTYNHITYSRDISGDHVGFLANYYF